MSPPLWNEAILTFARPTESAALTVDMLITARVNAENANGYTIIESRPVAYVAEYEALYEYDNRLNLVAKIEGDPDDSFIETRYEYDAMKRLKAIELPDGARREYLHLVHS